MSLIDHLNPAIWWLIGWRILLFSLITYLLYRLFRRLGTKAKVIDASLRWSSLTKPTIGGLVFYLAFCLSVIPLVINERLDRGYLLIFLAGTAAFLIGLWDDLKRIPASKKLIGQVATAIFFVLSGHATDFLGMGSENALMSYCLQIAITIFIVVAIMNSVNMLDNMDGIATIAAMPVMLLPLCFDCDLIGVGLTFFTAMCGFLLLNWTPSKVYMGDSGSMLLGFVVAWLILGSDWCGEISLRPWNGLSRLFILLGIGGLFITDTLVVVINRLRYGISPAQGGKDHTTHNLFYLGLKQWQIAVLFLILGGLQVYLVVSFVAENSALNAGSITKVIAPIGIYFFLLFVIQLLISFRNLHVGKYSYHK